MASDILSASDLSKGEGIILYTPTLSTLFAKTSAAANLCAVVIAVFLHFSAHLKIPGNANKLFI